MTKTHMDGSAIKQMRSSPVKNNKDKGCKDEPCCQGGGDGFNLMAFIHRNMKYFFHVLVLYLYPSCYGRFFFRNGDYPWNDVYTFGCMLISLNLFLMAHWSHSLAGPAHDPGVVEWEHFRSKEDQHLNREDRKKWEIKR